MLMIEFVRGWIESTVWYHWHSTWRAPFFQDRSIQNNFSQFLCILEFLYSAFIFDRWIFLEKVLVDNFHFYSSEDVIPLPPTPIVSDATPAVNTVSLGLPCPCHFCLAAFWIFSLSFAIIVFIIIYLAMDSDTLVLFGVFKVLYVRMNVFHQIWQVHLLFLWQDFPRTISSPMYASPFFLLSLLLRPHVG